MHYNGYMINWRANVVGMLPRVAKIVSSQMCMKFTTRKNSPLIIINTICEYIDTVVSHQRC